MEIIGDKIQIFVTEEEANVLLQACSRYTFHGPYWPSTAYQQLTDKEKTRADNLKCLAQGMCEALQDELLRRHREAEEIKFYQGR